MNSHDEYKLPTFRGFFWKRALFVQGSFAKVAQKFVDFKNLGSLFTYGVATTKRFSILLGLLHKRALFLCMDVLQKKPYNFKERTPCGHTIFFCMIFAGLSRHRCCDIFVGLFPKTSHGLKAHWWKETCKDMASFIASPPCSLVSTCRVWEFSILYGASPPCTNCDAACDICVRV